MKLKKIFALAASALFTLSFTACAGGTATTGGSSTTAATGTAGGDSSATDTAVTTVAETSAGADGEKPYNVTLKALVDLVPHSDIIEFVAPKLAEKGITIDIVSKEFNPSWNDEVSNGNVDFNFFQHLPYLQEYNELNNKTLVSAGAVHIEPIAAYSTRFTSKDEIPDGATVVIPDDPTNEFRALTILEQAGLIKLSHKEDGLFKASLSDIVENPKHLEIKEIERTTIPTLQNDVDIYITSTSAILESGVDASKYLFRESEDSPYANIIAVKEDRKDDPAVQELVKELQSKETQDFITGKYNGAVIPAK